TFWHSLIGVTMLPAAQDHSNSCVQLWSDVTHRSVGNSHVRPADAHPVPAVRSQIGDHMSDRSRMFPQQSRSSDMLVLADDGRLEREHRIVKEIPARKRLC